MIISSSFFLCKGSIFLAKCVCMKGANLQVGSQIDSRIVKVDHRYNHCFLVLTFTLVFCYFGISFKFITHYTYLYQSYTSDFVRQVDPSTRHSVDDLLASAYFGPNRLLQCFLFIRVFNHFPCSLYT